MSRSLIWWLSSLALHALLGLALILSTKPSVPPREALTFVDLPPPLAKATPSTPKNKPSMHQSSSHAKTPTNTKPSLAALTPSFRAGLAESALDGAPAAEVHPSRYDDPSSYGLSAATYDAGNSRRGFLEAIYSRINSRLIFDSILAQYGHFGVVYVEFEVSQDGRLVEGSLHATAADRILKVHAIRSALLPGLEKPLAPNLFLKEGSLKIHARFQFVRSQTETSLWDKNPEAIAGLAFTFRRFTGEGPVARTLGQHLFNGGLSYDPFAMAEAWKKYEKANERRRAQVDPFELYRVDEYY